jgi:pimeloyl-ACP methyl ester carboxylesterase
VRLILIAHSYGSAKIAYAQFLEPDPGVEALILCSPAALMRDTWKYYLDVPYETAVQNVTRLVNEGKGEQFVIFQHDGPAPIICTARTFLSVWGPDPAQEMPKFIGELSKPLLVTIGEKDWMCMDYSRTIYEHADRAEPHEFVVIPEGDHYYNKAERSLERVVCEWLHKLGLR